MRSKILLLIVTAVLAVIAGLIPARGAFAAGTGEAATEDATPVLELRYPTSVSSVPLLALLEQYPGDYSGAFFTDHPQALAQLVSGEIDVLATGFSVGLSRYTSAGDLVHLMTPVWGASAFMAARPVSSIAEISGGTVYAPFAGSPIDIYLQASLDQAGASDSVEIAYAPFPQAAALLSEGKATGAVLVEPLATTLELSGRAYRVENLHDGWARLTDGEPRSPQVSLFVTGDFLRGNRTELALLVGRLEALVAAVAAEPEAYAARFSEALGVPAPVLQTALANTLFDSPTMEASRQIITQYARVMELEPPGDDFYAELQ